MAVFVWTVQNYGKEDVDVSIMFAFQSGDGRSDDVSYGHYNEPFACKGIYSEADDGAKIDSKKSDVTTCHVTGVLLHRNSDPACTFTIAAKAKQQVRRSLAALESIDSYSGTREPEFERGA